jgi:thioredoxin reductase (NADPH)
MTTTEVENFPGFPSGIQGPELMDHMMEQAKKFGATLITEDATNLELTSEINKVTDSSGTTYNATSVILAMGSAYRKLGLYDETRLAGRGVSWCATCDGFFFRDKNIAVIGGGDSAVEEALFLSRFASTVTIVHRRDQLRASLIMQQRAGANAKIRFEWNSEVSAITGETSVEGVTLTDTVTGDTRHLDVEGVFVAIGHEPRNELVASQLTMTDGGYVVVDDPGTATSIPGVFACGDLVDYTYRQAITAAGSGCRAALDAQNYLASLH